MKVLVIGGGGREHALVWALRKCKRVDKVYCCPGNAGIAGLAECINNTDPYNIKALVDLVKCEWIDLTIVGPEVPLGLGIVDLFEREGLKIFGPNQKAAALETSKVFAKDFMRRHGLPTSRYKVFSSYPEAEDYIHLMGAPIVIKADGLAAGKGVIVAPTYEEAEGALRLIMIDRAFGDAGNRVIIEECLTGEEVSFMVVTDGKTIVPIPTSQDHKRVFDNDKGPNTGGMGAYSPAPLVDGALQDTIMETIMRPTISLLAKDGIKYKGVLYAGLMINEGRPYVLEYNCRLGDPEAQAILMRLDSDIVDICLSVHDGTLDAAAIQWKPEAAVAVVIAAGGYPGAFQRGKEITGLEAITPSDEVVVFHSGTAFDNDALVTASGRVLTVAALGEDIAAAKDNAYKAAAKIHFDDMHYRKDIAARALR
ncbi:phosphoribosylamine--glycine ligase [Candidatus Magnetominusculus dajiuhuensis]|uniref:phosphoribosylamine--glycine ligase n=1 Tax=Candidatus Magnetominusculus dajiuhuensis TaxID=3137712 RepID=UPI003B42F6D6